MGLSDAIEKALNDKKDAVAREGSCILLKTLCEQGVGHAVEPFIFEKVLHLILSETFADKVAGPRVAAQEAMTAFVKIMSPWATSLLLPVVLDQIHTAGKWQVKVGCLAILDQLVSVAPAQLSNSMPLVIPVLADTIHDTKADVKKAARATLTHTCQLISNKDIEKWVHFTFRNQLRETAL